MKKILILVLCCVQAQFAAAQGLFADFDNLVFRPCAGNPDIEVRQPLDWQIYQTTDGDWDGPVDSTRCISMAFNPITNHNEIPLSQIDPQEPLFVRWIHNQFIPFSPNSKGTASFEVEISDCADLYDGSSCAQDLCNGMIIALAIPDSNFVTGQARRVHTFLLDGFSQNPCFTKGSGCFPTEYFDNQSLAEVILKFRFDSTAVLNGKTIRLYAASVMEAWGEISKVTKAEVPPEYLAADGQYHINMYNVSDQIGFPENILAVYDSPLYPEAQHPYYIESYPLVNTSVPQTINLEVDAFQNIEIQPFVQFRGGLVENNDSLRHHVNLVNQGGEFCFNFIDLIFNGGDEYRHGGGSIQINNPFSCMQFKNGSALRVLEGKTLHFGRDGAGMLALCAGGTIALERNASLIIDCRLNLAECTDAQVPQQLYMDLPPGARLAFTRSATVTNQYSYQQAMHLNVRMLGGTLDVSELDIAERALIHPVYPVPYPDFASNIKVSPNPFTAQTTLLYIGGEISGYLGLKWYDIQGRLVHTQTIQTDPGLNSIELQPDLPAGLWFLRVENGENSTILKVIRII